MDHAAAAQALIAAQEALGAARPAPWRPPAGPLAIAACFCCFQRGGGHRAWAAAALGDERVVVEGEARAAYQPGLLALRELAPLAAAVRGLRARPDVVLADATGRDHPRRAGLALHLGWALDLPTVGVTRRLLYDGEGAWRTPSGLWIHAAWRTDVETEQEVVSSVSGRVRTPAPLREARRLARSARSYSDSMPNPAPG